MTTAIANATPTSTAIPTAPPFRRRRWTTAEFHRMIDAGILRDGSRTFLWDGEIIEPMPEKPPHVNVENYFREILADHFPRAAWAINQGNPVQLADGFEPQPDLTVLRSPRSAYIGRLPQPADVALLIEIASTSYFYDAGEYLAAYARAAIPLYWIVNLPARRIEVYSDPDAETGTYRTRQDYAPGMAVPLGVGAVAVEEVFRYALG